MLQVSFSCSWLVASPDVSPTTPAPPASPCPQPSLTQGPICSSPPRIAGEGGVILGAALDARWRQWPRTAETQLTRQEASLGNGDTRKLRLMVRPEPIPVQRPYDTSCEYCWHRGQAGPMSPDGACTGLKTRPLLNHHAQLHRHNHTGIESTLGPCLQGSPVTVGSGRALGPKSYTLSSYAPH